ncbi:MAG: hypothetical protein GXY58_11410 [Planctomycetaceae bacterium]|nr:hypothetical protein [Planctomycetaceae bacterium]
MTEPRFRPGQQAVVSIGKQDVACRIIGYEPGENARGFHGVEWVYHVIPKGADFGLNVPESAIHKPAS